LPLVNLIISCVYEKFQMLLFTSFYTVNDQKHTLSFR
jgi:hypothetical protein